MKPIEQGAKQPCIYVDPVPSTYASGNTCFPRKLLEGIYHILKDGKSFQEVERVVEAMGRGEPGNSSGNIK